MKCFQSFQVGYKHLRFRIEAHKAYWKCLTDLLGFSAVIFQVRDSFFLARCVIFGKAQLLVPECTELKHQVLQPFPPPPVPQSCPQLWAGPDPPGLKASHRL